MASLSSDSPYTWSALSRTKDVTQILKEVETMESGNADAPGLKRCLTRWDVLAYGVGSTVGAGIFVITGQGALSAGPAVAVSFLLAAVCCLFSAFSYAEFAGRVPVSGSAYTFTYVCLGELAAWFVGWNLTLEYAISAAAVARGFTKNLVLFISQIHGGDASWMDSVSLGGGIHISIFSLLLCLLCTAILLVGVKESSRLNAVITIMNVACILFIVIMGSFYVKTANYTQTDPAFGVPSGCNREGFFPCGFNGVLTGAAQVFFSFIGFDSVTTLAEEVSDPKVDIPFGVISTLGIASALYVAASFVVTGMVPWNALNSDTPLASAFTSVGVSWATTLIASVTVTALAVNTLCSLFGQPRIFFRMAKDGLLFRVFSITHPQTQTPIYGTVITGLSAGLIAAFIDLDALSEMISIGTLLAFSTVCAGVVLLRLKGPEDRPYMPTAWLAVFVCFSFALSFSLRSLDTCPIWVIVILGLLLLVPVVMLHRMERTPLDKLAYICPLIPFLPLAGVFTNIYLIASLKIWSYVRMLVWTSVGFAIYFWYGIRNSKLYDRNGLYQPLQSAITE